MSNWQEQYDTALLGILQNEGKILNFLDTIFGFLYRKTDFYLTMKAKDDKMGFPPGVAFKLTVGVFKKYAEMAEKNMQRREDEQRRKLQQQRQKSMEAEVPPAVRTEEVASSNLPGPAQGEPPATDRASTPGETSPTTPPQQQPAGSSSTSTAAGEPVSASGMSGEPAQTTGNKVRPKEMSVREAPDGMDDPEENDNPQQLFQSNPSSYNGAIRDNYSWSQSISDLDIQIKVPHHITKGRDCQVAIERKHLRAAYRNTSGEWVNVVNEALCWEVNKEESMWSLVPGDHIHVNLEKIQERWWDGVLEGEPKINVRKIDPSRPMDDLDDEAQAKIQEMMYNERQKRLGLPQSHEQKVHDMLKKAWDAEGSPFKGQEFDPSKFNISPNNTFDPPQ